MINIINYISARLYFPRRASLEAELLGPSAFLNFVSHDATNFIQLAQDTHSTPEDPLGPLPQASSLRNMVEQNYKLKRTSGAALISCGKL